MKNPIIFAAVSLLVTGLFLPLYSQPAEVAGFDTVTVTNTSPGAPNYAGGIQYNPSSGGINLIFDGNALVVGSAFPGGVVVSSPGTEAAASDQVITLTDFDTITTTVNNHQGALARVQGTVSGNAVVNMNAANGTITTGTAGGASGQLSSGIAAYQIATASGNATATMSAGTITTQGAQFAYGAVADINSTSATAGRARVEFSGGSITTNGTANNHGVYALSRGSGSGAEVEISGGTIVTNATTSQGAWARAIQNSTGGASLTMSGGDITTNGTPNAIGIFSQVENANGPASMTVTGGTVTTSGVGSDAARTRITAGGTNDVTYTMSGGTFSTTGDNAVGSRVWGNGTGTVSADVSGTADIDTAGANAFGVYVLMAGGGAGEVRYTQSGGEVNTTGATAHAVRVNGINGDATTTISAGTIGTTGAGAIGVRSIVTGDADSSVIFSGGTLTTSDGAGILSRTDGAGAVSASVSVSGGTIDTGLTASTGQQAVLANVTNAGATGDATIDVTGGSILQRGLGAAIAAFHAGSGDIMINGSGTADVESRGSAPSFAVTGVRLGGAAASTGGVTIDLTGGSYRATGTGGVGVRALSYGGGYSVSVDNATVEGAGNAGGAGVTDGFAIHTVGTGAGSITIGSGGVVSVASGVAIRDGDGDIAPDGSDEVVAAASGYQGGGNVTLTSEGTVTGDALLGYGDDTVILNGGTYTGTIFGDDGTQATDLNAGNDRFTWNDGALVGGFDGEDGSDIVTIQAAAYDGSQIISGGDNLTSTDGSTDELSIIGRSISANPSTIQNFEIVTLDGTAFTALGDFTAGTANEAGTGLRLINGSTLTAASPSFQVVGNLDLAAGNSMNLESGAGAGTFGVTGNLVNNGIIDMQEGTAGDRLEVGFDLSGNGVIQIDVDAVANTADTVVVGGTISGTNELAINVINVPTADVANGQILLVDSTLGTAAVANFTVSGGPVGSGTYSVAEQGGDIYLVVTDVPVDPAPTPTPTPTPAPTPTPVTPFIATSASVTAEGVVAQLSNIERLRSLRSRLGDIVGNDDELERFERGALWAQYQGTFADQRGSSQGAFHDTETTEFDFGGNFGVGSFADSTLLVGISGHYVNARTDSSLGTLGGSSKTEGAGIGIEATWVKSDGWYADAKLRHLWLQSDAETRAGGEYGIDSTVFQLSAEVGKRFDLGEGNWITPQAQIQYTSLDADSVTSNGTLIALEDGDAVQGRIGVDLGHTSDNGLVTVWTTANLIAELDNGSSFRFGNETLNPNPDDLLFEFGLGGSVNLNDVTEVYGEILGGTGLGNAGDDDYIGGNLGVRVAF